MRLTKSVCKTVFIGLLGILCSAVGQEDAWTKCTVEANDVVRSTHVASVFSAKAAMSRTGVEETSWHKLDAGAFSVLAPFGWKFHQLPGVDSYVGEFVGDGVVLKFDFGEHSNPLKEEK